MPRGRPKLYEIPNEWRSRIESSSVEDLNKILAEITKAEEVNQKEKEADSKVTEAKETFEKVSIGYKEATRMNKLKMRLALEVLAEKGGI